MTESSPYEVLGDADFSDADDANIPVNIFLHLAEDDAGNRVDGWELVADNFMPRRSSVNQGSYKFICADRQVLVDMVQKHWRPLYERALELLKLEPGENGEASMYYWGRS